MSRLTKFFIKAFIALVFVGAAILIYFHFYATPDSHIVPERVPRTPAPTESEDIEYLDPIYWSDLIWYDGVFELPISGSTGFAPIATNVHVMASVDSEVFMTLTPGQGFRIISESGDWWSILVGEEEGFVKHAAMFINMPDVIPSIRYRITNASSSLKRSTGVDIPGITGAQLYSAWSFNERLGRYEYIVPVFYATAKLIAEAQRSALSLTEGPTVRDAVTGGRRQMTVGGHTIIMYEAFRPRSTQRLAASSLQSLAAVNSVVNAGVNTDPWSLTWFISTGISNHQRGTAVDVSFGYFLEGSAHKAIRNSGNFAFYEVLELQDRNMPTAMHELSMRAISFTQPGGTVNARTMTDEALELRRIFMDAGFSPLASEWWHFNDLVNTETARIHGLNGDFYTETIYSVAPWTDGGGD